MTTFDSNTGASLAAEAGYLHVGAAKVEITPPADALPTGYKAIHFALTLADRISVSTAWKYT